MTPRAGAERGGGAATVGARAGPCSHHLGDAEGTGDSSRSADRRAPPRCPQPRAALTIAAGPSLAGARTQGTPNSPRPGRWSPNFLRLAARSPGCSRREAAPRPPLGGGEGRGGCCCGWERRPPLLTRAPPGSAASEVSALTLPLLWLNRLWVSPPSPRLPVSSLSSRAREYLKGPRSPFRASLYPLQTLVWQVLLVNISIRQPGCPTAPSGENQTAQYQKSKQMGTCLVPLATPGSPAPFSKWNLPAKDFKNPPGPV